MIRHLFVVAVATTLFLLPTTGVLAADSTTLLARPVPPAGEQVADMVKVVLAPGEKSPVHRHNAQTFVYVLSGTVAMAVNDQAPRILSAGDTFYEGPEDVHTVSRNESADHTAQLVVFLLKNAGTDK